MAHPILPASARSLHGVFAVLFLLPHQRNLPTNTAIDQEMQRTHKAGNLRKEYMQIKRHIQQHQRHRKVNIHAINLLDTAAQKFLTQFNQVITKNSSRMLPSFTRRRSRCCRNTKRQSNYPQKRL
jgi:hypothetical protein